MSKTKADWNRLANECAAYLLEKCERDLLQGGRPTTDDLQKYGIKSIHDYEGLMSELNSAEREIQKALKRLNNLTAHFELERLAPFEDISARVRQANDFTSEAWASVRSARVEARGKHPAKTREKTIQKAAYRLAHAYVGEDAVDDALKLTDQILIVLNQKEKEMMRPEEKKDALKISDVDPKTLENWRKEFKKITPLVFS